MEIIFAYPRAQALADGVLIDVTKLAREAGFRHSTALTQAAWSRCVAIPEGVTCQDEEGRLWDLLWMLGSAIARNPDADVLHLDRRDGTPPWQNELRYSVHVQNRQDHCERVELKAVCGPGDKREPVVTIMLPHED